MDIKIFDKLFNDCKKLEQEEFEYLLKLKTPLSYNNLGYCYMVGINTNKNRKKAIKLFKDGVKLGDSYSMCNLANIYYDNNNYEKAKQFYEKSIEMGNIYAMQGLGNCYYDKENYEKAIELYEKSANLGITYSMQLISNLYKNNEISDTKYEIIYNNFKSKYTIPFDIQKPKKRLTTLYNSLSDDCLICYDKLIGTKHSVIILTCGHIYHKDCIQNQLKCPYCREII